MRRREGAGILVARPNPYTSHTLTMEMSQLASTANYPSASIYNLSIFHMFMRIAA